MRSNWLQVNNSIHIASIHPYILIDYISFLRWSISKKDTDIHTHSNNWAALSAPCSQRRSFLQFNIAINSQSRKYFIKIIIQFIYIYTPLIHLFHLNIYLTLLLYFSWVYLSHGTRTDAGRHTVTPDWIISSLH